MKFIKIISFLLALCLLLPSVYVAGGEVIDASLDADKDEVKEGEGIRFEVFVDTDKTISGGVIRLLLPDSVFAEPSAEYTLDIDEPIQPDSSTPVAVFDLTVSDSVLEQSEVEATFTVSIDSENSNIESDGNTYNLSGEEFSFKVTPSFVSGQINAYINLESTEGISAALVGGEQPVNAALELSGKKIIYSIRRSLIDPQVEYKLTVTAPGFTDVEVDFDISQTNAVTGFYPGDVSGDGKIDVYDFNLICSYISYEHNDAFADLNKDTVVDISDVQSFAAGYKAKNGGGAND